MLKVNFHNSLGNNVSGISSFLTLIEKRNNIVVNDIQKVWNTVKGFRKAQITLFLDNSGFELYADLIFMTFLIDSGYVAKVCMYGKGFPWFVSDVIESDVESLFCMLEDIKEASELLKKWAAWQRDGIIEFRVHPFHMTQHSFWRMKYYANKHYEDLVNSDLVILKGDLNYRKLTSDVRVSRCIRTHTNV